jgi:hypothetical protein
MPEFAALTATHQSRNCLRLFALRLVTQSLHLVPTSSVEVKHPGSTCLNRNGPSACISVTIAPPNSPREQLSSVRQ